MVNRAYLPAKVPAATGLTAFTNKKGVPWHGSGDWPLMKGLARAARPGGRYPDLNRDQLPGFGPGPAAGTATVKRERTLLIKPACAEIKLCATVVLFQFIGIENPGDFDV